MCRAQFERFLIDSGMVTAAFPMAKARDVWQSTLASCVASDVAREEPASRAGAVVDSSRRLAFPKVRVAARLGAARYRSPSRAGSSWRPSCFCGAHDTNQQAETTCQPLPIAFDMHCTRMLPTIPSPSTSAIVAVCVASVHTLPRTGMPLISFLRQSLRSRALGCPCRPPSQPAWTA